LAKSNRSQNAEPELPGVSEGKLDFLGEELQLSNTINRIYIDMQPAALGTAGQLIMDVGMGEADWWASRLNEYLTAFVHHLESGRLVSNPVHGDYTDTQTGKSASWIYLRAHP
jgi:hypothetical protein